MAVTLIDRLGDDLTITNAARVSFAKRGELRFNWDLLKQEDPDLYYFLQRQSLGSWRDRQGLTVEHVMRRLGLITLRPRDIRLIHFLARNRHSTPFEHVVFQFLISCGIDEAREWQRHRIASYNEISTRYAEVENDFIVPDDQHITEQYGEPGEYFYLPIKDGDKGEWVRERLRHVNETGYGVYRELLEAGISRQVARKALTLAKTTEFYVTANLRSWFNFMSLRTATTAFDYIADDAREIERLIKTVVPHAMAAWEVGGRLPI